MWIRKLRLHQRGRGKDSRSRGRAEPSTVARVPAPGRDAWAPCTPESISSPALVMEGVDEAEADCSVAFAEAQRWVEVSASD